MATHPSALKRARQSEIRRLRNKHYRTRARGAAKKVRAAAQGSPEDLKDRLSEAVSIIQKAASKGAIHKNKAARRVSRLTHFANKASRS